MTSTRSSTPSLPAPAVLAERLRRLLAGTQTFALLSGDPAVGIALVTLRPNVWYPGPGGPARRDVRRPQARGAGIGGAIVERLVADCRRDGVSAIEINVDEGDVDAQRFYERHGFHGSDPQTAERAYYFFQEL